MRLETLEARAMLAVIVENLALSPATIDEGGTTTLSGQVSTLPVANGLKLWLDASDSSTIVTDANGRVEQWRDKSGLHNDATQSNPAMRPTRELTAFNGKPAIRLNANDDPAIDELGSGMVIADSLNLARPYTIFIATQFHGPTGGRSLQSREAGVNWLIGTWGHNDSYYSGGTEFVYNAATSNFRPTIGVGTGGMAAPFSQYYVNGRNLTTDNTPQTSPGRLGIGDSGTYQNATDNDVDSDIAEILVYDRILSDGERQSVEKFLAQKYGMGTAFTGGDVNEGLDLDGTFAYAVNFQADPAPDPPVRIRDANFTSLPVSGITLTNGSASVSNHTAPNYGATLQDDGLEIVNRSIRHTGVAAGTMGLDIDNLVPGKAYKLQLIFSDASNRGFDIRIEGQLAADNYSTMRYQGDTVGNVAGSVFTYEFVASDSTLNLVLDGSAAAVAGAGFADSNPIISALTLEDLAPADVASAGSFTGGDPGEGLDLQGNFIYAVNAFGPAAGQIQDANFTADNVPGVTITAPNTVATHSTPDYGSTTNDNNLETVSPSLRWNGAPGTVGITMANIVPGERYKLQLLFADNTAARQQNIIVEGQTLFENFSPGALQAGQFSGANARGAVVTYEFTAGDNTLDILLTPPTIAAVDNNPIINGFTLEQVPANITNTVVIDWDDNTQTTIELPLGVRDFSVSHVYADNKPDGQASGMFTPLVTVTNSAGESASSAPVIVGDPLIDRPVDDGAAGYLFLNSDPFLKQGRVRNWRFFDDNDNGQSVTPLLLEKVGNDYFIRGVGTTRNSNASGIQSFPFDLVAGTDVVSENFYLGWKDGSNAADNDGVINFSNGGGGVQYFAAPHIGLLTPNRNLGAGTTSPRVYSVEFTIDSGLDVTVNNVAPTAVLGAGPFIAAEGNGTVVLAASAIDPAGANDAVTFAWDLDNDGIFGETGASAERGDEVGATPTFSAIGVDGPATLPIRVRATDSDGATGAEAIGSVTIESVDPTVVISGPATTSPGFTTTYTFTTTDPSPADQAGAFTYTIDWGDGSDPETITDDAILSASHAYAVVGPYTIIVSVEDQNGAISDDATFDVEVTPIAVIGGKLIITGTDANDRIVIQPGGTGIKLRMNNRIVPTPPFTQGVVVLGLEGNDTITFSASIGVPVEVYGGAGNDYIASGRGHDLLDGGDDNDRITGGGGNDTILGGEGNDNLVGGIGDDTLDGGEGNDTINGGAGNDTHLGGGGNDRINGGAGRDYLDGGADNDRIDGSSGDDLLLGGVGGDQLFGGAGKDVLLGGLDGDTMRGGAGEDLLAGDTTTSDLNPAALALIWSQWTSQGMAARPALTASHFNDTTIADNDGFDLIYGEAGNDWYLTFEGDTVRDVRSGDFRQNLT